MSRLFALVLLLCSFILAAPANANDPFYIDCPGDMNDTSGSVFQANLDPLLFSLTGTASVSSGFATETNGAAPNQTYGLAQCRADVQGSYCRACLDSAAWTARKCPADQKNAMVFYEQCLLRHSNASFLGRVDTSLAVSLCNSQNATQQAQFMSTLSALMESVTKKAAYASPRMFAVGSVALTPFNKLYGMVQCTRDLAPDNCNRCLVSAVGGISTYCNGKQGGRLVHRSCSIRFELYLFYNPVAAEAAMTPGSGPPRSTGSNRTVRTSLLISVPVSFTLLVLLFFATYICKKRNSHGDDEMGGLESLHYALSTLRAATDNFSEQNRLGRGAFGPVYKGKLQNGQEIAVKRLSRTSRQGQTEMKNEVALVAKLQHKNLVRLVGYCIEKHERLLVYEFLKNKSLDKILYGPTKQLELSWTHRYKIIYGIGRGLMYLHEDSRLTIIHRDLKPGNILLDEDMNPKISDFGLAKLFHIDLNVTNTSHIAGTRGYMAPEYTLNGIFSVKSDVFSYGVLILEVITGRRPSEDLLEFVWKHWSQGNIPPLLDSNATDEPEQQQMLRCIHIGLLCVQDDPELRPRMADVVLMFNSHSMTLVAPTEPVLTTTGERSSVLFPESSINEASISKMEPR